MAGGLRAVKGHKMERAGKQKWEEQVEEILRRSGFGEREGPTLVRLRAILERLVKVPEDALIPPEPWLTTFSFLFACLDGKDWAKVLTMAFMLGEVWQMHKSELIKSEIEGE